MASILKRCIMVVGIAGLAACARVNETAMLVMATTVDAYAVVDQQLLQGDFKWYPDRTGVLLLQSPVQGNGPSSVRCTGGLRFDASHSASLSLRCSGGQQVVVPMGLLSETRAYGYAQLASGPVSVVVGMDLADARPLLYLPHADAKADNPAPAPAASAASAAQ